jgi:hypothetical protein
MINEKRKENDSTKLKKLKFRKSKISKSEDGSSAEKKANMVY